MPRVGTTTRHIILQRYKTYVGVPHYRCPLQKQSNQTGKARQTAALRALESSSGKNVLRLVPGETQVPEEFIHPVGRTGRAGACGTASTFATPGERAAIRRISGAEDPPDSEVSFAGDPADGLMGSLVLNRQHTGVLRRQLYLEINLVVPIRHIWHDHVHLI